MATSSRLRFSKPWCSAAAIVVAAFGVTACGGGDESSKPARGDDGAATAGTASAGTAGNAGDAGASTGGSAGANGGSAGKSATGGGGGKAGSGNETACDRDPVCHSLSGLGVDTTATPRLDHDGNPLPDSWNPLGSQKRALFPVMELFAGGMKASDATNQASVLELNDDNATEAATNHRLMRDLGDATWTTAAVHAAVAADLDGDGIQEIAGVWLDGGELMLRVISDVENGDNQDIVSLGDYAAESIAVAAGDFDGDGKDELAVAIVLRTETQILFVGNKSENYAVNPRESLKIPRADLAAPLTWKLSAGNIDNDAGAELAGVANAVTDWDSGEAISDYWIWDDESAQNAELDAGPVIVRDGGTYAALTASPAIVDIDNDGLGEVVLAAITTYDRSQALGYALVALDDAPSGLSPIATKHWAEKVDQTEQASSPRYMTVWVNGLDVDGDLVSELQVNEHVLANLSQPSAGADGRMGTNDDDAWPKRFSIPLRDFQTASGQSFELSAENSVMAVGDLNGDKRDDIVFLSAEKEELRVFGMSGATPTLERLLTIPVTGVARDSNASPLLVPVNVDHDTPLLELSKAESRFVFTEPVLIAAVAAPPCAEGIGQNTDACVTSFGHGTSEDVTAENSVTLSASLTVGVSFEERLVTQSEVEIEATATIAGTHTESNSYTVEKSVTYTTGPMEDSVVFTTVPYDSYVYTYLSHPDPDMVGQTITIYVPREPVTLMTERTFYNEHVLEGSPKVDEQIFQHTIGDIASYPTPSDVTDLQRLWGGIDNGPELTSQGTGDKTLGIDVGSSYATGNELSLGFEIGAKLAFGGVMAGFSIGAETSDSLTITSGSSTSYSGTVGAIDAEHFADNQYSFGLFTYSYEATDGRQFEVVNYWVE